MARNKDVVLMATVSSYESMTHPGRHELRLFAELFEPVFKASGLEARRNAVAALARCAVLPRPVAWFIGTQPIEVAAIFLTRSMAVDDDTLISIARTQGTAHARAIAARESLSVKVVDALVSLHQGAENERPLPATPAHAEGQAENAIDRHENLRQSLKQLIQRDTVARAAEHPFNDALTRQALLVRFARLRQASEFSTTLAEMLDSSVWLTNRILLDLSGQQLATALIAVEIPDTDGLFILKQFYPHLKASNGESIRADMLWHGLRADDCVARVGMWIKADAYTQGERPAEGAANANPAPQPLAAAKTARRATFGQARAVRR